MKAEDKGQSKKIFINRELSWLAFNLRVLDLSKDKLVPLGEQLKFVAIYASNLNEFFMVRVGALYDQTLLKKEQKENKTNMTAQQQLDAIMPRVGELQKHCDKNVAKLFATLEEHGLQKVDFSQLDKREEMDWKKVFLKDLYPILSPQIIGRRHPFPFLRSETIYIGATLAIGKNGNRSFGLIPVSTQYNRLLFAEDENNTQFALVEELMLHFADFSFGEAKVLEKCIFQVTRNADIDVEEAMFEHDLDYRDIMSEVLKKRRKLAPVRLQFHGEPSEEISEYLLEKLLLPKKQKFVQAAPLSLSFMFALSNLLAQKQQEIPSLFYPPMRPIQAPKELQLYETVSMEDVLICYPYQSIRPFVEMLRDAAKDPNVVSIKMTLYRVASESKIIEALIEAAENGKEVVTVVELRARFDEQNNIDWSRELERAGCTVIYGFTDYKVHSKITLITRKRGEEFEYITQVGTGNYNEKTSEQYTDLSFVSADHLLGAEVATVFNNLAVEQLTQTGMDRILAAPLGFKSVILHEMKQEIAYQQSGGKGSVVLKCNSISDIDIIESLSKVSQAGIHVDMIVRGICCLQSGLEGLTDTIHVRSVVGRYLEHSRIYAFGKEERERIYIASGDFLTRNTERRVEVGIKITNPDVRKMLRDILDMQLADNVNAREMRTDGEYYKIKPKENEPQVDSQMDMYGYLADAWKKLEIIAIQQQGKAAGLSPKSTQHADEPEAKEPENKQQVNETGLRSWASRLLKRIRSRGSR